MSTVRDTTTENKIDIVTTTGNDVTVTQPVTNVIQVATPGPAGPTGPAVLFDSGSYVTTSSFNSFTSSIQSEVDNLTSQTGSYTTTSSFNSFTSSIQTEVDNLTSQTGSYTTTSSFNTFTSSIQGEVDNLTAQTGSYVLNSQTGSFVTTSSFNSFTSSIQTEVDNLTAQTSSYVINSQTGSFVTTSSFNLFTSSIQGEVDSLISQTGSYTTTSSFNSFTSSIQSEVNNLTSQTGSYTTTSSFNAFTSSIQTEVDNLTAQTGSYVLNSQTGSFATTGSNNFIGNQVITGSLTVSGSSTFTNIGPSIFSGSVDITGSLNLDGPFTITGSIESPTSITFDTTTTDTDATARLKWNETEGTLDLGMGGGLATLQIGQELYYPKVVNKSGEDLINGTLVMVDPSQPAQGNRLRVIRAVTDGTYPSELIVGPLTEDVDNNQEGFATWFGYVRNLNRTDLENNGVKSPTDTWVEGSILYTNPNLDGGYTSSMQPAPAGKSSIAAVTAVNGQNITLLVRPKLDTNVGNLHDVTDLTTTSSYGDLFIKSGNIWTTSKFLSGSYSLSGSLTATEISSSFSGSFQGDGSGLTNIPASGIVGLNLSQIASGSATASISPDNGFVVNTNITASGNISASAFIGDGSGLSGVEAFPFTGSAIVSGSLQVTGSTTTTQLGVGAPPDGTTRLDVRAQGALSTDTVFRVRNSTDTFDLLELRGDNQFTFTNNSNGITAPFTITSTDNNSAPYIRALSNGNVSQASLVATRTGGSGITATAINRGFIQLSNAGGYLNVLSSNNGFAFSTQPVSSYNPTSDQMRLLNGNLSIGTGYTGTARLDVRAQGALSTDIAFRVRNSVDTIDLFNIQGDGAISVRANKVRSKQLLIGGDNLDNAPDSSGYEFNTLVGWSNENLGLKNTLIGYNNYATVNSGKERIIIGNDNSNGHCIVGSDNIGKNTAFIFGRDNRSTAIVDPYIIGHNNTMIATGTNGYPTQPTMVLGSYIGIPNTSDTNYSMMMGMRSSQGDPYATLSYDNFLIGTLTPWASGYDINSRGVFYTKNSTVPTSMAADSIALYSADITAGNAAPHFRTEAGDIVKLYTQPAVTSSQGLADVLTNVGLISGSSVIASPTPFPYTGSAEITGSLTVTGSVVGAVQTLAIVSSTASLDLSQGNFFELTLESGSVTHLSPTNIQPGQTINLKINQPATSGSLTYDSTLKFPGGIPYNVSATGSVVDILSMVSFDSSTLYTTAIKNLS